MTEETMLTRQDGGAVITIPADLALTDAVDAARHLAAALDQLDAAKPVEISLSAGRATVPALQLVASAACSLTARGIAVITGGAIPPGLRDGPITARSDNA
ncbi:MAG: hypothetical protein AAF698_10200 [Pseudomonadota bacterium]